MEKEVIIYEGNRLPSRARPVRLSDVVLDKALVDLIIM